jgi:hypothetical protein
MADVEQLATGHYVQQQRTVRRAANAAQAAWRRIAPGDLDASWQALVGPALVHAVTAGQQQAASPAQDYVTAVVVADGLTPRPEGTVNTSAFSGQTADGRSLMSLMYQPVIETKWRLLAGQSADDALFGALSTMLRAVETEVADAGREAGGVAINADRTCTGYVRVLNPPSCARCAVLAGKVFHTSIAFQRHPHCDCTNLPTTEYRDTPLMDPAAYFHSLSEVEQARIFTGAGAQAIRDGADISSVVNARRGMYTADAYGRSLASTYDSTTRRGAFFRAERQRAIDRGLIPPSGRGFQLRTPRLLPEEIYRTAESRDEVIAMLRRYGYLT